MDFDVIFAFVEMFCTIRCFIISRVVFAKKYQQLGMDATGLLVIG
jgi:hypothetical protein